MKKFLITVCMFVLSVASFCQSEKYMPAMKNNIAQIEPGFRDPALLLAVANNFERIAVSEKNQWLPYYYAAYCHVMLGFMEKDKSKVDVIADKASALINKADSISSNNSEISCIKSMIATCHLIVNPMQRWMQYGQESSEHLDAAIKQDSANPRPNFLKGQSLKNTPEQFGGGCNAAKVEYQKSLDKFATFKPLTELHPVWGKARVEQLMLECN
jgi:hypothetical protein